MLKESLYYRSVVGCNIMHLGEYAACLCLQVVNPEYKGKASLFPESFVDIHADTERHTSEVRSLNIPRSKNQHAHKEI
jgi:hypothetical protein